MNTKRESELRQVMDTFVEGMKAQDDIEGVVVMVSHKEQLNDRMMTVETLTEIGGSVQYKLQCGKLLHELADRHQAQMSGGLMERLHDLEKLLNGDK